MEFVVMAILSIICVYVTSMIAIGGKGPREVMLMEHFHCLSPCSPDQMSVSPSCALCTRSDLADAG